MTARNPMKDKVVIVGIGATKYGRDLQRTANSLGLEAAKKAILDAGLTKADIDGICGSGNSITSGPANHLAMQEGLDLGPATWVLNVTFGTPLVHAAHAVFSGACEVALIVQAMTRPTYNSTSARNDPIRVRAAEFGGRHGSTDLAARWNHSGEPYAAWATRYMHDTGAPRQVFGMIAVNNRTNASMNEHAVMRKPITMDDYLSARMIREPLCLLDCDLPVDAAEAMVITTAERAKRLPNKPVYIHATTIGQSASGGEYYENGRSWTATAPWVAMKALWPKSDLAVGDMDLFFPYDGYTPIAVAFTEAAGFCKPGGAWQLFQDSWVDKENRLRLNGKTYVSTNGGSMSHGRLGGFNYYTEAVRQLRGEAGTGQIPNAKAALTGIGSFYHDPSATILRVD